MSAVLKDRDLDPPEFVPQDWHDLGGEQKSECLALAMIAHPRLIDKFYLEALSLSVDPFKYRNDI